MNVFARCVISCKGVEEVASIVRRLIYEPNELDEWDVTVNKSKQVIELSSPSQSLNMLHPLVSDMSLACRLHLLASSFHDLRIDLNKRVVIAKVFRNILQSDPGFDESDDIGSDQVCSLHAGALDGCFVVYKSSTRSENDGSSFRLPTLNWHDFRKGYTIMMWVKPTISSNWNQEDKNMKTNADSMRSTLYRLRSFARRGKFVDASLSPFLIHIDDNADEKIPLLQSHVEIISYDPGYHTSSTSSLPRVGGVINLVPGEWQLVAITHSFPYLKKPHVMVSVNGNVMVSGDLSYPSLDDNVAKISQGDLMEDCVLLENIVTGEYIFFYFRSLMTYS